MVMLMDAIIPVNIPEFHFLININWSALLSSGIFSGEVFPRTFSFYGSFGGGVSSVVCYTFLLRRIRTSLVWIEKGSVLFALFLILIDPTTCTFRKK